ncbi:MAG: amino acid adenylation domain-containing protein [Ignavibacteria bacterium]|nr:amino acid adenylation domain-containing protein [Ignavibacteria bacterium]
MNSGMSAKTHSFAQANRITVTLIQGVWSLLLHNYTRSNDITFGNIVSGRPHDLPGVERRVGLYINTLPLHSVMSDGQNVIEWLQAIQEQQVSSRQFELTPLNEIQGWTGVKGDLFDTLLVFENYPISTVLTSVDWGLKVENPKLFEHNNYPLTIMVTNDERLSIEFKYNSSLLEEFYLDQIVKHFEHALSQILNNGLVNPGEIKLLDKDTEKQQLIEFNKTEFAYPKDKTIVDLFEDQAEKTPDSTALVFEERKVTYKELNELSNRLAHYLQSTGLKKGTLVPVCIERSIELMTGILGILKAGCAYVPVDPAYPEERIRYMLKDTGAGIILSSRECVLKVPALKDFEIIEVDSDRQRISEYPEKNLSPDIQPESLAYVIYTSGSTGIPKGVMVTQRNVVSLVKGVEYVSLGIEDILLSTGSSSFDATTFEYWSMLLNGGQLVLCTESKLLDNEKLKVEIRRCGVNKMWFTSSWFNQLTDNDISVFEGLKTILVGGEKLSEYHIERLRLRYPEIEIINGYGPTENTTFSLTYKITERELTKPIPIGRPFHNRTAYVLNDAQHPVPIGVPGEIYLGGAGISKGYLNSPELTLSKFIKDPFDSDPESKLYRTGDLGRRLPDGNIEYLGRMDDQVKIRGYRVEPGEIESVLQQHESVKQAVVIAMEEKQGTNRLIGYIVPDGVFDRKEIISYLERKLPEYMVPAQFVEMVSMPLTSNGKIDRKALPEPDAGDLLSEKHVKPESQLQISLAEIWTELLEVDNVGIHDDFFELGGHSLLAIRLISAIRKNLEVEIDINSVFEYTTIETLADYIQSQSKEVLIPVISKQERPDRIPLSYSQERLWFIDQFEGSVHYHVPVVLRLKGNLNRGGI